MKLWRLEPESRALVRWLADYPDRVSSILAVIEVRRAARAADLAVDPAESVLGRINLLPIDDATVAGASSALPPRLRSLDAIHLATALSIGPDLDALVTYDRRLGDAASAAGLRVAAPS